VALIEREARIVNPLGMHARPAAEFVKTASRFRSAVQVSKDGLSVNGKSILGVMMLVAERGSSMRIKTEGDDAEVAMAALLELVAKGFNEMHLTGSGSVEGDDESGDDGEEEAARP
jgi:phosphocarrier protein